MEYSSSCAPRRTKRSRSKDYLEAESRSMKGRTKVIKVSAFAAPKIIGHRGERLARIRSETGCDITISPFRGPDDRTCIITGAEDGVSRAAVRIHAIIDPTKTQKTISLKIPATLIPILIGRGGGMIRSLEYRTCTRMYILPERNKDNLVAKTLLIQGENDLVHQAREFVLDFIHNSPIAIKAKKRDNGSSKADRGDGSKPANSRGGVFEGTRKRTVESNEAGGFKKTRAETSPNNEVNHQEPTKVGASMAACHGKDLNAQDPMKQLQTAAQWAVYYLNVCAHLTQSVGASSTPPPPP